MRIIFILFKLLIATTGCMMSNSNYEYPISEGEKLVNHILAKTARAIKIKYKINPCGMGVAMPGGPIQELTLCFYTECPYTKKQLRELLIKSAQELANAVSASEDIQEHLASPPFTINDVQIIIYNHEKNGIEVYDPGFACAEISHGILVYDTVDANYTFTYKNEFTETLEKALTLLGQQ